VDVVFPFSLVLPTLQCGMVVIPIIITWIAASLIIVPPVKMDKIRAVGVLQDLLSMVVGVSPFSLVLPTLQCGMVVTLIIIITIAVTLMAVKLVKAQEIIVDGARTDLL